jgi:hypothetical protein
LGCLKCKLAGLLYKIWFVRVLSSNSNNVPIVIFRDGSLPTTDVAYKTCAMEADTRHVEVVNAKRFLVYSLDMDVSNISIYSSGIRIPSKGCNVYRYM